MSPTGVREGESQKGLKATGSSGLNRCGTDLRVAGLAVHERLLPRALPSPPTWLAVGKRARVAVSAVLQGPSSAGLLSWGISVLLIVFPLLVAEKENVGFAGKAKCTSHSPADRWVLETRGWGMPPWGGSHGTLMHPWVLLWVPSRAQLPTAPSWLFPITAALGPRSLLPQEQGL